MFSDFLIKYHYIAEAVTVWALEYGYIGAFLVSFSESIIVPLFPDPFIIGAVAVGLDPWIMVLMVMVGTILGAIVGYFLGRWLGHPAAVKLFGKRSVHHGEKLMEKYGVWAVIITGLTPIPFKVVVWLAGIFEMPFGIYMLAVVVGRLPRFALVAWLGQSALNWLFG